MTQIHDVPDDWNPDHRCCLECGNSDPEVTLRAITHSATYQQALTCTRHIADVSAILDEAARHTAAEQAPKPAASPTAPSTPAPRHRSRA
ncbi:hypothetical protein [Streptomyces venezuelae]|uniref:hypothetical protein n=1 Tax=Streptomyces venezuelae TaxID=54571 RepID=UPI0012395283|nr:hypothetical protein [Streptomyces venezuelae]